MLQLLLYTALIFIGAAFVLLTVLIVFRLVSSEVRILMQPRHEVVDEMVKSLYAIQPLADSLPPAAALSSTVKTPEVQQEEYVD